MTERTLVLIKPDAVRRRLVGEIISRLERKDLTIDAMVLRTMDAELADAHYAEHVAKPFYPTLKAFMTSGPLVAMIVSGDTAIEVVRGAGGRDGRPQGGGRARCGATSPCPTRRTSSTPPTRRTAPSGRSPSGSPSTA